MVNMWQITVFLSLVALTSGSGLHRKVQELVSKEGQPLEMEIKKVLEEVTSGPLANYSITLMVEEETEMFFSVNALMKEITSPTFLLLLPQGFLSGDSSENIDLMHSVLVIVVKSKSWWPLVFPSDVWSPIAIVLLVLTKTCQVKDFLETPLLEKSASVAVFCPLVSRKSPEKVAFKVWTWKPFAANNQLVNLGYWSRFSFPTWKELFVDRFQDFSKKKFAITFSKTDEPVLFEKDDGTLDGTNYRIVMALSQWLNTDVHFTLEENNSWIGMREEVRRGNSDIMLNYVTITLERTQEFDVSVSYQSEGFGMIMKIPPTLPPWRNLYYPFSWEVWMWIIISYIATTFTFHLLNYSQEKSFMINAMTISQCLMSHPIPRVPDTWRERSFLLVWDFIAWLLTLSYTCNLIAVLTIPVYPTEIQTAQELVDSEQRVCMMDYGEFVPEALAVSTHPTLSALGKQLVLVPMSSEFVHWGQEGCIEKVLANTHAHLETYYFIKILYSDLGYGSTVYSLKEQIYVGNLAFLFKKHTPWKEKFNTGMRRLIEAGLVAKFYADVLNKYENTEGKGDLSQLKPLTVAHLQGPFMMMLAGLAVATLVLAGEILLHTPSSHN